MQPSRPLGSLTKTDPPRGYMFTVDGRHLTIHVDQDNEAHIRQAIRDFERAVIQLRLMLTSVRRG